MGVSDVVVVLSAAVLIFAAIYIVYYEMNSTTVRYSEFVSEITYSLPNQSLQFSPNMRFKSKEVGYFIDSSCNSLKKKDIISTLEIIESQTPIIFVEKESGGIYYNCSGNPEDFENHETGQIVVGTGRPDEYINLTKFSLIKKGTVHLLSEEKCDIPQVAIHETLHALGFDHSNNPNSIMYPITGCNQIIDDFIIDELNRLYSINEYPDLVIDKVSANKTGRYMNVDVKVINAGLKDAENVLLEISSQEGLIKNYTFGKIEIGKISTLSIYNLATNAKGDIFFRVNGEENDLDIEDNYAVLYIEEN